jgi:hypothetical protein
MRFADRPTGGRLGCLGASHAVRLRGPRARSPADFSEPRLSDGGRHREATADRASSDSGSPPEGSASAPGASKRRPVRHPAAARPRASLPRSCGLSGALPSSAASALRCCGAAAAARAGADPGKNSALHPIARQKCDRGGSVKIRRIVTAESEHSTRKQSKPA